MHGPDAPRVVVHMPGILLALLLFDMANDALGGDVEGLLFGQMRRGVDLEITDHHEDVAIPTLHIVVTSFLPVLPHVRVYDAGGEIDPQRLLSLLSPPSHSPSQSAALHSLDSLIGMFKFRRNAPLSPTLRDIAVYESLQRFRASHQQSTGCAPLDPLILDHQILGLFTASADEPATLTQEFGFFCKPVTVALGNSTDPAAPPRPVPKETCSAELFTRLHLKMSNLSDGSSTAATSTGGGHSKTSSSSHGGTSPSNVALISSSRGANGGAGWGAQPAAQPQLQLTASQPIGGSAVNSMAGQLGFMQTLADSARRHQQETSSVFMQSLTVLDDATRGYVDRHNAKHVPITVARVDHDIKLRQQGGAFNLPRHLMMHTDALPGSRSVSAIQPHNPLSHQYQEQQQQQQQQQQHRGLGSPQASQTHVPVGVLLPFVDDHRHPHGQPLSPSTVSPRNPLDDMLIDLS
ncbi:hypothetical protein BC831DRAFT_449898 [Entophlyctis helioformis]|nr:hypothetical protein BC831DRAFT_449898 [Entophlyctis helioformis]